MYRLILVPVDGSALAARAIPYAEDLARATGARLLLLRTSLVRNRPPAGTTEAELCAEEEAYLEEQAGRLRAGGIDVTSILCFADADDAIVDEAARWAADLIVMTTHGRGWMGRLAFGSVATAVLERAPVPVLFLPEKYSALPTL
jgi:nucleotide-binding universal stress UspA family protein